MKFANNKLLLAILSIFCIVMIAVTTVHDEWLSPFRTAVGCLLMPVQSGVNRVGKSLYNNLKDREKLKTALEDNKALENRISELVAENTRLENDNYELGRLRDLYDLSQSYGQYRMTGARVIAKDTGGWFHVFRIDKGYADGIQVDMNVMADGGLVGIVTDVGSNYATVRSIIDDVSRVSGMAARSGDSCIVSGDLKLYQEGKLRLSDITDTADIKDGDRIVTSNISSKYVPGLLIGYAKDITTDPSRLTQSGYLIPVADFGTLQEVLVVLDLKSEVRESGSETADGTSSGQSGESSVGGTGQSGNTGDSASGAEETPTEEHGIVPSLETTQAPETFAETAAAAAAETAEETAESSGESENSGSSESSGSSGSSESSVNSGDSGSETGSTDTPAAGSETPAAPPEIDAPAESGGEESTAGETEPIVIVESVPQEETPAGSENSSGPGE